MASQGDNVYRQTTTMLLRKEGRTEEAHFMITASSIFNEGEDFILLTLEDVTELKKVERELENTANKLHTITSVLGEGVYVLDVQGLLTFMNPEAERLLGWTEKELLGKNVHEAIHFQKADGTPLPASECPVLNTIRSNACYRTAEDVFTHKDGTMVPVAFVSTPIWQDDKVIGSVCAFHDITGRKKAQEELQKANELLEHRASTDVLTGIFNRLKFNDLLEAEIQRTMRHNSPLSLIMFDVDHFKKVNDTYGHHVGDDVLKDVTRIVNDKLRKYDFFARWGGEEFIILTPYNNLESARHLAERLRESIAEYPFAHGGRVTCSFGVAEFGEGDDSDTLPQRVDDALYKAKKSGRNKVETA
jgi:diguanylate cyclase (GGDEF)-like protein/PAS domain S-box-containing protein